jgi:hypothetical protein
VARAQAAAWEVAAAAWLAWAGLGSPQRRQARQTPDAAARFHVAATGRRHCRSSSLPWRWAVLDVVEQLTERAPASKSERSVVGRSGADPAADDVEIGCRKRLARLGHLRSDADVDIEELLHQVTR